MDLLYILYLVINFWITIAIMYVFADRIGHINYEFCKAHLDLPIKNNSNKEMKFFPQKSFILDRTSINQISIFYQALYKINYQLHICNYVISSFNILISLIGFVVIHFIDSISWILVIVFSGTYLISIIILAIISFKVSRLKYKVK